ncbi:MAG: metallophosphoesterase [Spirochaetaceae bacterium]|nr:metallophosphoesterase [Spirochaetaceae bacterium]
MLYITGDTHNTTDMSNLASKNMKLCCMEQRADFKTVTCAIVLGDFGLPWFGCSVDENGIHPEDGTDRYLLKWYNQKPFKILAVMGNHENYDMIEKLPSVEMFGGTVLKVSSNIFYLKRGEAYTIEDKKFLVLGGAKSEDKAFRVPHESWWPEEEWNETEKAHCLEVIRSCGGTFDYVLSHTGPSAGIMHTDSYYLNEENLLELKADPNVCFNDQIDSMICYKKWFFGHWHSDWGYENYKTSKYVPLYHTGIVL